MKTSSSSPARATAVLAASLALATAQSAGQSSSCPQIHVLGARETLVPAGFGSSGLVVQLVQDAFGGGGDGGGTATTEVIDYPAAGASDEEYAASVRDGIAAVVRQVSGFARRCPDTTMVLVGYSQGSQIMDTAFCGGPDGSSLEDQVVPMPPDVGLRVAALVWMGNPRHVDGLPYNAGTAVEPGFAARPENFICQTYANNIRSYCDKEDPFCARGDSAEHHQQYGTIYGQDALDFVLDRLGNRGIRPSTPANTSQIVQERLRQAQQDNGGGGAQVTVGLTSDLTLGTSQTATISGSPATLALPTQTSFVPPEGATGAGGSPRWNAPSLALAGTALAALLLSAVF